MVLSQIVRHRGHRFCHEFQLLPRDAPSSKLIMIFVQHLDSTSTVHTAQHTQGQFSGHHVPGWHRCRARVSRRKSQKILPPPFTGVGTLSHSSTCRCLFTPREYYVRENFNSLIIMRNVLVGESTNSFERWRQHFFGRRGVAATDSRTESILARDMVTAELPLCSVHGTRAIQVLHKDHDELAAGCIT